VFATTLTKATSTIEVLNLTRRTLHINVEKKEVDQQGGVSSSDVKKNTVKVRGRMNFNKSKPAFICVVSIIFLTLAVAVLNADRSNYARMRQEGISGLFANKELAVQTEPVPSNLRKVACVDDGQASVIRAFEIRGYHVHKIPRKLPERALKECNKQVRIQQYSKDDDKFASRKFIDHVLHYILQHVYLTPLLLIFLIFLRVGVLLFGQGMIFPKRFGRHSNLGIAIIRFTTLTCFQTRIDF